MASTIYNGNFIEYPSNEKEFDKWLDGIKAAIEVKNRRIQYLEEKNKVLENEKQEDNKLKNTIFEVKNKRIQYLEEKNKTLEQEKQKDNELQNMKKIYDEMKADYYRGFPISKEEQNAINEWQKNHLTNQHNLKTVEQKASFGGAIGGSFKFEFIPTSIGTIGTCVCGSCRNRARRDAKGNGELFQKLIEEYDAEFVFQNI